MSERDMQALIELIERHLGVAWADVVDWLRKNNSLDDIAARFEARDIDGVIAGLDTAAAHFATATHAGYIEAGQQQAAWLAGEADALVRFDVGNDVAVRWAQRNTVDTVRQITQDQRDMIRQVVTDGVREGRNPREVARDIRDSIGLTDYQTQIVENYRTALESGDYANALGRELSHGASDQTIAAAARRGIAMKPEQIDLAVGRYRTNMVNLRAETIARTEALRVAHQGSRDSLQQAVDRGDVEAGALTRQWNHSSGGKAPRAGHRRMDGQRRGLDEPFVNPDTGAQLAYPGDPSAGAEETANCRCAVSTRLNA